LTSNHLRFTRFFALPPVLSALPHRLLVALFLLLGLTGRAEPIAPLLPPAEYGRLRVQLWHTPASPARVSLLLALGNDLLARHDEVLGPLDSAAAYSQQAYALSGKLGLAAGRIGSLYLLGQLQEIGAADTLARAPLRAGIALSRQQGSPKLEAYGWYYLANSYPRTAAAMVFRLAYYQRASQLFRRAGAKLPYIHLLKTLADMHLLQGRSAQAEQELLHVLALYRAAGRHELHYTYDLLRAASRQAGNYQKGLGYGLAAIESAHATHDTVVVSGFYSRVAGMYAELKQDSLALVYYHRALRHAQQTHFDVDVLHIAGYIAHILISEQRPQQALDFFVHTAQSVAASDPVSYAQPMAECYMALQRYQVAERYLTQMLALIEHSAGNDMQKMYVYQATGTLYQRTKRYDKARWYLQQALRRYQYTGHLLGVADLHLLLFKVDSAQGRFPAAIAHYQRYKMFNDSIFNERKNKQLASLQIQYDTRKKEQNIVLLTKTNQVQQTRLKQREFQRNALLAGAALLALLLGLGYNRYRLKQRATQLLEAQQREINHKNESLERLVVDKQSLLDEKQGLLEEKEELLQEKDWMLKEIHHRVKNNLQIVSSLLSAQADYLRDPAALAALRESQNRVQAIALVHQKLYQSESVALVNMQAYIQEITEHLLESFDCLDTVREKFDVAPVELEVALATPLGLILNEAITNALKHAFPLGQRGTLSIRLQPSGPLVYELRIADDGVGLPPHFNLSRSQSMGLTMINGLSKQINGALDITQAGPGTQLTLRFEAARKHARAEGALA
jgi:two-component sensor histidine kinase